MKTHWFPSIRPAIKPLFLGGGQVDQPWFGVPFLLFRLFWGLVSRCCLIWMEPPGGWATRTFHEISQARLGGFGGGIFSTKKDATFLLWVVREEKHQFLKFFVCGSEKSAHRTCFCQQGHGRLKVQKSRAVGCWMDFCTLSSQICWKHSLKINCSCSPKWRQTRNAFPFQTDCFADSSRWFQGE